MSDEKMEHIIDNTKNIVDHEARLKILEKTHDVIFEMNENIAVIANQTVNQGNQLEVMIKTLKEHDDEIRDMQDDIKAGMSAKASIKRVWAKLEEIEDSIKESKDKDAVEFYENWNQFKWIVIRTGVGLISTVIGAAILIYLNLK